MRESHWEFLGFFDVFGLEIPGNLPSSAPNKNNKNRHRKWPLTQQNPTNVGCCLNGNSGTMNFVMTFPSALSSQDGDLQVLPRFLQQGRTGRNSCFAWLLRAEENMAMASMGWEFGLDMASMGWWENQVLVGKKTIQKWAIFGLWGQIFFQ